MRIRLFRPRRRWLLAAALIAVLGLADAFWIEPRLLLFRDVERIGMAAPLTRIAHLSDLHIRGDMPLLHRLLGEIAAARPDLIVISGDLIHDVPDADEYARNAAAVAAFVSALRRIAPVYAVQGHSEHQGELIALLAGSGLEWLSNEGRRVGPGGSILLLGLNTQVGDDWLARAWRPPFRPVIVDGARLYGARRGEPYRNFFSHWDPEPAALADEGGPLAWSGYEVTCDAWIDDEAAGVGLAMHSRFVRGEDAMIQLHRDGSRWDRTGAFSLVSSGSGFDAGSRTDTGVRPRAGRWYRLKVRTDVLPDRLRVRAKAWPAGAPEPRDWQADAVNSSPRRAVAGTVALWASGGGTTAYRNLRVVANDGRVLLDQPLTLPRGAAKPSGFREGTRGTRLEMALARSPEVQPGTPVVALSHVPDVAREAAWRGLDAVIAGHTHGGQLRLPLFGPLTTRSSLGVYYDRGRFAFPAPNPHGVTTLYINSGVGMSVLPARFFCPPKWALLELGDPSLAAESLSSGPAAH